MKTQVKKLSENRAETLPPAEAEGESKVVLDMPVVEGKRMVTREMFLERGRNLKLPTESVPVPEMDGWMVLSELSASRQDLWESVRLKVTPGEDLPAPGEKRVVIAPKVETDYTDYRARAVALSLVDPETGEWMCTLDDAPE